jgi:hypothetical protein
MAARYEHFSDGARGPLPVCAGLTDSAVGFGPDALRAAQATILWAASTNTVPTAFWVVYHVSRDPALLARVRSEIDSMWRSVRARGGTTALCDGRTVLLTRAVHLPPVDAIPSREDYATMAVLEAVTTVRSIPPPR